MITSLVGNYDLAITEEHLQKPCQEATRIVEKIAQKGFCVIKYAADDDLLKAAINDVRKLERSDRFEIPPVEVVEGLLGSTGSTLTCDLDMAGSDGENQGLLKADQLLTAVGSSIAPLSPISLGFLPDGRTPATIHVADAHPAQGEPTVLHEEAADQWMAVFTRHRIMLILFMGPSDATLELTPFRHDDAESVQVSAEPGTIVALRADALVHKVTADKKSLMLTTFLYCETLEGPQSDLIDESSVPVARSLWQWCEDRMRQLKDIETMTDDGPTWDPTVPRHWQAQMNRLYHKGPQAAARSFLANGLQVGMLFHFGILHCRVLILLWKFLSIDGSMRTCMIQT